MKNLFILLSVFLVSACAGTSQYQQYQFSENGKSATVKIVRSESVWGSAIPAPVYLNEQLLGRIGPGGYLSTKVPVGEIAISSTTSKIIVNTEEEDTYYFKVRMPFQFWIISPDFDVMQITEQEAKTIIPNKFTE